MNKIIIAIFAILISNIAYSQNIQETQQSIKYSVENLFSYISGINDPVEQFPINTIVDMYGSKGNYFYFNGNNTTLRLFLNTYIDNHIKTRLITHKLSGVRVSKINKSEIDKRYKVDAILTRVSATGEDIVIKDEKLSMVVLWDNMCSILELNFNPSLDITYPTTRYEYTFKVDYSKSYSNVRYEGEEWRLVIISKRQTIKEYSGYPAMTKIVKNEPWDFQIISDDIDCNMEGYTIKGELGPNLSKDKRVFNMKLLQKNSGMTMNTQITQKAKEKIKFIDLFAIWDRDISAHNVSVAFSLKYQMGLSYMYTFDDSRFSLGALLHANVNSFKGWKIDYSKFKDLYNANAIVIVDLDTYTYESNGYEISVNKVKPSDEYSSLFDPYNTAKTYVARSLYLIQSGIYLNDWVRLELGLGAAAYKDKIHVDNVYKYESYTYTPLVENNPPIDEILSFSWYDSDYFFKGKYKWDFALRTGMNCCIPIGYCDYLNLGVGYVVVPNNTTCNSFDFQIGFGWAF